MQRVAEYLSEYGDGEALSDGKRMRYGAHCEWRAGAAAAASAVLARMRIERRRVDTNNVDHPVRCFSVGLTDEHVGRLFSQLSRRGSTNYRICDCTRACFRWNVMCFSLLLVYILLLADHSRRELRPITRDALFRHLVVPLKAGRTISANAAASAARRAASPSSRTRSNWHHPRAATECGRFAMLASVRAALRSFGNPRSEVAYRPACP